VPVRVQPTAAGADARRLTSDRPMTMSATATLARITDVALRPMRFFYAAATTREDHRPPRSDRQPCTDDGTGTSLMTPLPVATVWSKLNPPGCSSLSLNTSWTR
jgi:hypothetical protein